MKLISAYLKNFAGIYRASGLEEIFIDFSRSINNVVLITGPNGSGKSTILNALNPLVDNTSCFIKGREGIKELQYLDEGVIYKIRIMYPVKYDFSRATTKAFFYKIYPDGTIEDKNSNGNVTSFKDIVYEVFGLDPSYISLTKLSIDDGGIVSKTPSERKRFVTNILEAVDVYNNIYKVLSKRSSVFKSMINSIASKINNIGNEESLRDRLLSIEKRLSFLELEKEKLSKAIAENEAIVKISDPDGLIQNRYNELVLQYKSYNDEISNINIILSNSSYHTIEECIAKINQIISEINRTQSSIDRLKSANEQMILSMNSDYEKLLSKQAKLDSLQSTDDIQLLKNRLSVLQETNDKIMKSIPNNINIDISLSEFTTGMKILEGNIEDMNRLKEQAYDNYIKDAVQYILDNKNPLEELNSVSNSISLSNIKLKELQMSRLSFEKDIEISSVLSKRPDTCKNDECEFIKNALESVSRDPEKRIKEIDDQIYDIQLDLTFNSNYQQDLEEVCRIYNQINIILRNISGNSDIYRKMGTTFIIDRNTVLKYMISEYNFNTDKDKMYNTLQYINNMETYKANKNEIDNISMKLEAYKDKVILIEELTDSVSQLQNEVDSYDKSVSSNQNAIDELSQSLIQLMHDRENAESYRTKFDRLDTLKSKVAEINSKINIISNDIKSIESSISNINNLNSNLMNINRELSPLKSDRDNIAYSINMLESYNKELEELNLKYDKIETIKKYSSPNKGIQTLYMELYMGKTLRIANELLSMMFNGNLVLLDYIINEDEFRIPCKDITSDIINDDIRSCSSAQRAMIGMIISLALFTQSSTKCNIVLTDEIDGTLDEDNRAAFIPITRKMMDLMHIDQWIMISHASESELSNVDIIALNRDYRGQGNVIFHY